MNEVHRAAKTETESRTVQSRSYTTRAEWESSNLTTMIKSPVVCALSDETEKSRNRKTKQNGIKRNQVATKSTKAMALIENEKKGIGDVKERHVWSFFAFGFGFSRK